MSLSHITCLYSISFSLCSLASPLSFIISPSISFSTSLPLPFLSLPSPPPFYPAPPLPFLVSPSSSLSLTISLSIFFSTSLPLPFLSLPSPLYPHLSITPSLLPSLSLALTSISLYLPCPTSHSPTLSSPTLLLFLTHSTVDERFLTCCPVAGRGAWMSQYNL